MAFILRNATADDIEFIYQVRQLTMKKDYEKAFGWDEEEQRKKAEEEISNTQIIMIKQKFIGVIKVIPTDKELVLHQMQILPEYQGNGIGTKLVCSVLDRAEKMNISVTLLVLKGVAAKRLYDRLGFLVTNEYDNHYKMCWKTKSN